MSDGPKRFGTRAAGNLGMASDALMASLADVVPDGISCGEGHGGAPAAEEFIGNVP